ncbi:UNVERIFIED_CONTAM: hypothetical protein K2H54_007523 [Gekko kuhli]
MASSLPAAGDSGGGEGSSGEGHGGLAAAAALGESPGPGSDSEGRSSPPRALPLSLAEQFERAAQRVPALAAGAPKEQLLHLYARYKQSSFIPETELARQMYVAGEVSFAE